MFQVYFSHEKRINVLAFSVTTMDSDSWYDGLKTNWYEIYYKTNEQTNKKEYADNTEVTEAERLRCRMHMHFVDRRESQQIPAVSVAL